LLLEFMDKNCDGHLPHWTVTYTLPGWNGPREEAAIIHARLWIGDLIRGRRRPGSPTRLEAVAALGQKEAALVADLLTREKPAHGHCGHCDVEGDSRRVRIFAAYVLETCGGELPRQRDVAELAGWKREGAGVAQVRVGKWWYDFSSKNDGDRKKRVAASARDEATKKALRDLAQCKMREHGKRDVEGDSRRVRIFATHVRKNGLPTCSASVALADWEHEGADVAQVRVRQWWLKFSRYDGGKRKKRVAESARDEATQDALQYLAQCEKRDSKRFKRQRN